MPLSSGLLLLVFVWGFVHVDAGDHEKLLYDRLQHGYNRLVRPVKNESEPIAVVLGIDLQQIVDVDEKSQTVTTSIWLRMSWHDAYLTWDPMEYGGIKEVRLPIDTIWKPDVLLYNSVEQRFDTMWPVNSIITYNGNVTWIPPAITRSSCRISITWFPFDEQECTLKFGSWSYSSFHTDLYNRSVSLDPYTPNGEWILFHAASARNLRLYDCCPDEPYIDITFTFKIRRRTLYYGFNLVIPSVLISSLALLSFTLPPDSGEKLNLCVTILVSLSIFMVMVAETMPQTADSLPLIAIYFTSVMFEVGASVVCTVIVLNYHHRHAEAYYPMSTIQRKILLKWLPTLLCMRRPPRIKLPFSYDHIVAFKDRKLVHRRTQVVREPLVSKFQLDDVDSRLLALPSVFGKSNGCLMTGARESDLLDSLHLENCPVTTHRRRKSSKKSLDDRFLYLSKRPDPEHLQRLNAHHPAATSDLHFEFGLAGKQSTPENEKDMFSPEHINSCGGEKSGGGGGGMLAEDQFKALMSQLRILTANVQKDELLAEVRSEWMFAAMVVDRICFISFTFFLVACTATIVWQAPHLIA